MSPDSEPKRPRGLGTPMYVTLLHEILGSLVAAALVASSCGVAQAGWITLKNDTNKTIVVQEIVDVNGQVKRGKPTSLLPGETLREFLPSPTVKKIEVFEAQNSNKAMWSGSLNCKEDSQTYSVSSTEGKVSVTLTPCPQKK
jgi:hypothetical protein